MTTKQYTKRLFWNLYFGYSIKSAWKSSNGNREIIFRRGNFRLTIRLNLLWSSFERKNASIFALKLGVDFMFS